MEGLSAAAWLFLAATSLFQLASGSILHPDFGLSESGSGGSGSGSADDDTRGINLASPSQSPTSITLSWEQPAGDIADGFVIDYAYQGECILFAQENRVIVSGATTEFTLRGLQEFSSYAITVTAVNSGGTNTSDVLTVNTTAAAPSGPPQSVTATEITSISITIRWDRVSCTDRNSEITGYTVQYGQSGSGAIITETINGTVDSARLITTIGLTADTSYTYQVAAFSSEGTGPFSTDITVTTAGFAANLLPFGFGVDTSYDNQDDGSRIVGTLSTPYVLYGTSYTTVFVGSNGQVSFNFGTSNCCARRFPISASEPPLVTAFWNDINPSVGGVIFYRIINIGSELLTLRDLLRETAGFCPTILNFTPSSAAVITFDRVSRFSGSASVHNTFQTILLTDGVRSYSVFLYNSMNWGGGDTIGFSNGTNFYTLEGGEGIYVPSFNVGLLPISSNVDIPGTLVFRTDLAFIQEGMNGLCPSPAPLAPTNLASPSQSPTSITLSWEQPAGANVDSYTITFDYQGECSDFNLATDFRFSVNGNVTEFTMRDLQEFSSYVITVTAVNSGGSNTSEVLTVNTTSAAPSGPPLSVLMSSATTTSITIRWDRVNCFDRNSEITGYTVQYGPTASIETFVASVSGTSDSDRVFTATGLTRGVSYSFQVAAVGSEGTGPFSSRIIAETVEIAPMSPTNLTSSSQSPTSITLSWEQPAGDVVDRYVIDFAYQGECSGFFQVVNRINGNGNVTEFTLRGLQEFSSYAITVTAVNSGGSSTSEVLTVNTTAEVPRSAPLSLDVLVVGSRNITITWGRVACIDRNSEITGYTVRYGQTGNTTTVMKSVSGTSDSDRVFTATGLAPSTSYFFQVAAVSSEGTGPFSSETTAETQESGFSANLLPFGFGLDTSYDNQDDGSTMVGTLSTPYVLYGTSYTTVFVGSNGQVSFNSGTSTCCSRGFPTTPPLVTAFWNDINPATGGIIFHRIINSGSELLTLRDRLRETAGLCPFILNFTPSSAAVITFERVSAFSGSSAVHNTFQTVLLTDGVRSFSVFLYNSMNWGDGATIGFSDGTNFYTLEGGESIFATSSNVLNLPTLTNVGTPGVFIFSTESLLIRGGLSSFCPPSPPLAPTNLASPSQSPTSITLSWEQPAGDIADEFVIDYAYQGECSDFAQENSVTVSGATTELTLRGLQEFSSYAITVTAVNSGGSNTSEVLTVNTTAAAPSGPPLSVMMSSATTTSITIRWDRVICIDRNSEITGYTVQYAFRQTGNAFVESVMIRVSGTSDSDRVFTAIGLTPGVIYAFQVAAVGSEFNSRGPFTSSLFVETERPTVGLVLLELAISEGIAEEICVEAIASNLNFTVSLQQGNDSRGELVVSPAELHFFSGDTEKCFTVEAVADSTLEQTLEEYTLQLNASSNLVILSNTSTLVTVTIVDQDYVFIEPVVSSLEVPEGDNVTVCVVIGEGSAQRLDRAVIFRSVGFATGTPGEDFSANAVTPRTFQFPRGSSSGREICTVFTAFQDSVPEPEPESVTLVLEAFDIAVVIPQDTVTFTIIDDDVPTAPPTTTTPPPPDRAVSFIGDTPIVNGNTVIFTIDTNADSIECRLSGRITCSAGRNSIGGLDLGRQYTLRVITTFGAEVVEERRSIYVPALGECSVVLINDGLTVDGRMLEVEFSGTGRTAEFDCRIDNGVFSPCESPHQVDLSGVAAGGHRLRIIPTDCEERQGQSFTFVV